MSDEVLTEERDGVLVVSLNRPEARNAVNEALATAVAEAMERLDESPHLRVGVITGTVARSAPAWTSRPSSAASTRSSRAGASPGWSSARRPSR